MSLQNLQSPFGTPGAPPPGTFDPTKIAQQMQTDPNVRTMFAHFFGDPASRDFIQKSGNITSALARPDNPWGGPVVAMPSAAEPGASQDPTAADHFLGGPATEPNAPAGPAAAAAPVGPPFASNSFSTQGAEIPGRPVAAMDNVHGARKALMLAFLGLNKFGAGLDHQQDSYADQFLGNEMKQGQAQRDYDANAPLLRQQAINAQYARNLGWKGQEASILHTGAETGLAEAQTRSLALNPPGKAEFLKELQDRRRLGADDPQALFNEYAARAAYAHATPDEIANIIKTTPENAPTFKIGQQGIREPLTWHGRQWYGNEPDAPQPIKDAAAAAQPVEDKVHANKVQEQGAAASRTILQSDLQTKTKNLETGQKNANDSLGELNKASNQQKLIENLAKNPDSDAAQVALLAQMGGIERPEGMMRIPPTLAEELKDLGGLSEKTSKLLMNWKQGDVIPQAAIPELVAAAKQITDTKIKNANDALQSNFETYGYKHPGAGAKGRFDEVTQQPNAGTGAGPGTAKVATKAHIADYATTKGITVEAATKEFTDAHYTIQ